MTAFERAEDSYLYHGGCQDEPDQKEILCECGHYCLEGDAHELFGEAYCDECYQRYMNQLSRRFIRLMDENFTKAERELIYEELL